MLERVMDVGHKIVSTSLVLLTVSGFTFVGFGCYDLITAARKRKEIMRLEKAAEEATTTSN